MQFCGEEANIWAPTILSNSGVAPETLKSGLGKSYDLFKDVLAESNPQVARQKRWGSSSATRTHRKASISNVMSARLSFGRRRAGGASGLPLFKGFQGHEGMVDCLVAIPAQGIYPAIQF